MGSYLISKNAILLRLQILDHPFQAVFLQSEITLTADSSPSETSSVISYMACLGGRESKL